MSPEITFATSTAPDGDAEASTVAHIMAPTSLYRFALDLFYKLQVVQLVLYVVRTTRGFLLHSLFFVFVPDLLQSSLLQNAEHVQIEAGPIIGPHVTLYYTYS